MEPLLRTQWCKSYLITIFLNFRRESTMEQSWSYTHNRWNINTEGRVTEVHIWGEMKSLFYSFSTVENIVVLLDHICILEQIVVKLLEFCRAEKCWSSFLLLWWIGKSNENENNFDNILRHSQWWCVRRNNMDGLEHAANCESRIVVIHNRQRLSVPFVKAVIVE